MQEQFTINLEELETRQGEDQTSSSAHLRRTMTATYDTLSESGSLLRLDRLQGRFNDSKEALASAQRYIERRSKDIDAASTDISPWLEKLQHRGQKQTRRSVPSTPALTSLSRRSTGGSIDTPSIMHQAAEKFKSFFSSPPDTPQLVLQRRNGSTSPVAIRRPARRDSTGLSSTGHDDEYGERSLSMTSPSTTPRSSRPRNSRRTPASTPTSSRSTADSGRTSNRTHMSGARRGRGADQKAIDAISTETQEMQAIGQSKDAIEEEEIEQVNQDQAPAEEEQTPEVALKVEDPPEPEPEPEGEPVVEDPEVLKEDEPSAPDDPSPQSEADDQAPPVPEPESAEDLQPQPALEPAPEPEVATPVDPAPAPAAEAPAKENIKAIDESKVDIPDVLEVEEDMVDVPPEAPMPPG